MGCLNLVTLGYFHVYVSPSKSPALLWIKKNVIKIDWNRAFSPDVMLSSNMAASVATEINIHLCKHLFTLLCVTVSP